MSSNGNGQRPLADSSGTISAGAGAGAGFMDQILAMQSVQAMQSILGSKDGITTQSLISFFLVSSMDIFKRTLDASLNYLIENRTHIALCVMRIAGHGWNRLIRVLVSIIKFKFVKAFATSLRNFLSGSVTCLKRSASASSSLSSCVSSCNGGNTGDAASVPVPTRSWSVSIDMRMSSIRDWACLLEGSTDYTFQRMPDFCCGRIDATHMMTGESLSGLEFNIPRPRPEAKMNLRFLSSVDVFWSVAKGDVSRKKVYDVKKRPEKFCIQGVKSLLDLVPFKQFAKAFHEQMHKCSKYKYGDKTFYTSFGDYSFAPVNDIFCAIQKLMDGGMTFDNEDCMKRCTIEVLYLISFAWRIAYKQGVNNLYGLRLRGTLFGISVSVTLTSMFDYNQSSFLRDLPQKKDAGFWLLDQLDSESQKVSSSSKTSSSSDSICSGTSSFPVVLTSENDYDVTDEASLINVWYQYLDECESNYERVCKKHDYEDALMMNGKKGCYSSSSSQKKAVERRRVYALSIKERSVVSDSDSGRRSSAELLLAHLEDSDREEQQQHVADKADISNRDHNGHGHKPEKGAVDETKMDMASSRHKKQQAALDSMRLFGKGGRKGGVRTERFVMQEIINTTHRDLSTVYLREKDEKNLVNCLLNFRDHQDLLNELGIPNKLGVMLHGLPGTGKSSTIAAIASYLDKDIFYLHLNGVRSNTELKMAFDHVMKNHVGGGIIVMEDIDAMTDIVKKRHALHDQRPTLNCSTPLQHHGLLRRNQRRQVMFFDDDHGNGREYGYDGGGNANGEEDQLTLEFFLNLLQGSLTMEGTIFVATTNHLEALDPAFYRRGRFDVVLEMRACDRYQIRKMFRKFFGRDPQEHLVSRIPEDVHTPAYFISEFVQYVFRSDDPEVTDELILAPFLLDEKAQHHHHHLREQCDQRDQSNQNDQREELYQERRERERDDSVSHVMSRDCKQQYADGIHSLPFSVSVSAGSSPPPPPPSPSLSPPQPPPLSHHSSSSCNSLLSSWSSSASTSAAAVEAPVVTPVQAKAEKTFEAALPLLAANIAMRGGMDAR